MRLAAQSPQSNGGCPGMTNADRIVSMLKECQVPMRTIEIAKVMGFEKSGQVTPYLARLVKRGRIRKAGHGLYESADRRTIGELAKVEVKRDVKPVVQASPKVELKPAQGNRTVNILLEVISKADDPKPYAGVLKEIGDLLAAS